MKLVRHDSKTHWPTWMRSLIAVAILLAAAFVLRIWAVQSTAPLSVWVLDIGQGDAIFLRMPDGSEVLVDSGNSSRVLRALGWLMEPWDRTIEAIIPTHPQLDHIGRFDELLERYRVERVYETGQRVDNTVQATFDAAVAREQTKHTFLKEGQELLFGDATLRVIAPDADVEGETVKDPNDASVVLLLTYGETTILLTGDASFVLESDILADLPNGIDVLKVAHHGSRYSTSEEFLAAVHPRDAIISVGEKNSYGHPHPFLLERLAAAGAHIWRTDLDGDIRIRSSGMEPEISARPLPF